MLSKVFDGFTKLQLHSLFSDDAAYAGLPLQVFAFYLTLRTAVCGTIYHHLNSI